jgi:hypothetical protein
VDDKETVLNLKLAVIFMSSGSLLLRYSQPPIFDGGDDLQRKKTRKLHVYLVSSRVQTKGTVQRLGCYMVVTNSNIQQTTCKILRGLSDFRRLTGLKFALHQKFLGW